MHPATELDDLAHQRVRLGVLAVLHEAHRADFRTLADVLGPTAGNLSRNLTVLEQGGLVRVGKGFEGRRPRTWVQATPAGREALDREVAALRDLLHRLDAPAGAAGAVQIRQARPSPHATSRQREASGGRRMRPAASALGTDGKGSGTRCPAMRTHRGTTPA